MSQYPWHGRVDCAVGLTQPGKWDCTPDSSTRRSVLGSVSLPTQGRLKFSNLPSVCSVSSFFQCRFCKCDVLNLSVCPAFLILPRTQEFFIHSNHLSLNFGDKCWSACQDLPEVFRTNILTELRWIKYISKYLTLSCALGNISGNSIPELDGPNYWLTRLHPETSEKITEASEYFAKSLLSVLGEDMFIQETMRSHNIVCKK